jgi:hypothetical protein
MLGFGVLATVNRRVWSSGLYHCVLHTDPDISEEHNASFFRVNEKAKQETSKSRRQI